MLAQNTSTDQDITERTRVLVVDDEPATLKIFCMFLEAYGYHPLRAESGPEALSIFAEVLPPIVFTDIKMPGMDGIEVLKRIKAMAPTTEVVVITGHGDMDLAIKALNNDATDFINKPIKRHELENALVRAGKRIDLSQIRQECIDFTIKKKKAAIKIAGNVDAFAAPFIWDAYHQCLQAGVNAVDFIFSDSASFNGAGMENLREIFEDAQNKEVQIIVSGISSNFKKVFHELGLSNLLSTPAP